MIYKNNHLEVVLTRAENGFFICDKTIDEILNADEVYGIACEKDKKVKIRLVSDGTFEGLGYTINANGEKTMCLNIFTYNEKHSAWRLSRKTLERVHN